MYIRTSFDFYDSQLWRQQSETWRFPPGTWGNWQCSLGKVLTLSSCFPVVIGPTYFLVVVLAHDCSTVNGRVFASCARLGSWKLCISSRLLGSAHLCIRCQKTKAIVRNCLFATENTTRSIVKYSTCPGIWHLSQVLLQTACPQVTCTYPRCYFITLLRWAHRQFT